MSQNFSNKEAQIVNDGISIFPDIFKEKIVEEFKENAKKIANIMQNENDNTIKNKINSIIKSYSKKKELCAKAIKSLLDTYKFRDLNSINIGQSSTVFANPDPLNLTKKDNLCQIGKFVKILMDGDNVLEYYVPSLESNTPITSIDKWSNTWNNSFKYWQIYGYLVWQFSNKTVGLDLFKNNGKIQRYSTFVEKKKPNRSKNGSKNKSKGKFKNKRNFKKGGFQNNDENANESKQKRNNSIKRNKRDFDKKDKFNKKDKFSKKNYAGSNGPLFDEFFKMGGSNKLLPNTMKKIIYKNTISNANQKQLLNLWNISNKFLENIINDPNMNLDIIKKNKSNDFVEIVQIKDPFSKSKFYSPSDLYNLIGDRSKEISMNIIRNFFSKVKGYENLKDYSKDDSVVEYIEDKFENNENIMKYFQLLIDSGIMKENLRFFEISDGKKLNIEKIKRSLNLFNANVINFLFNENPQNIKKIFFKNYSLIQLNYLQELETDKTKFDDIRSRVYLFLIAFYHISYITIDNFINNLYAKYNIKKVKNSQLGNNGANNKINNEDEINNKKKQYIKKLSKRNQANKKNINKIQMSENQKKLYLKLDELILKNPENTRLTELKNKIINKYDI